MKNFLSVIVPAYKERTIRRDLREIDKTLKGGLPMGYDYEIICVVDGSPDNTFAEAKKAKSRRIKVLTYEENMGKGYAVRYGMKVARGNFVSFMDAGREISAKGMMMLMAHMDWYNADIIVGSKRHPVSNVHYPFVRHIFSIGYHFLTRLLFGLNITDTQSGLKIFKRRVIGKILPKLLVKRYAMDIEMLAVAKHFGFSRIYEAPLEIRYSFGSLTHASTLRSVSRMVWDTLAVFYQLNILHYYDTRNRKKIINRAWR